MPFALLFLVAGARVFGPPTPELLRLKSKVGQRFVFANKIGMTIHRSDVGSDPKEVNTMEISFISTEAVVSVKNAQTKMRAVRSSEQMVAKGSIGTGIGERMRGIGKGTSVFVWDRRAQIVGSGSQGAAVDAGGVGSTLPEVAVSAGSTWEGPYGSGQDVTLRYTLRGIAKVGTRRVALVDITLAKTSRAGFIVDPGNLIAIDVADGRWLRMRGGFRFPTQYANFEMRSEVVRVGAPEWKTILAAFPESRVTTER